jgi:hypothetical protein
MLGGLHGLQANGHGEKHAATKNTMAICTNTLGDLHQPDQLDLLFKRFPGGGLSKRPLEARPPDRWLANGGTRRRASTDRLARLASKNSNAPILSRHLIEFSIDVHEAKL